MTRPRPRSYERSRPTVGLTKRISAALLIIALAGCSGSAEPTGTAGSSPSPSRSESVTASSTAGTSDTETAGMYDVGGHKLYMSCAGEGPTTVVFVHGWVNDAASFRTPTPPGCAIGWSTTTGSASTIAATSGPARPWTRSRRRGTWCVTCAPS